MTLNLHDVYVPSEGAPDADIFLVGESPGRNEAQAQRPFVGRAGQTLDNFLRQVGLRREELYISNSVKYLPREPKEKFFFNGDSTPTPVFAEGIAELKQEIQRVRPNVVVPLGNYALWALTGHESITRYRGSILESTLVPGQKVIPALHPAFLLRQWARYPLFVWDLRRIKAEARTRHLALPEANYIIRPDSGELAERVSQLLRADIITIDTEWFSPDDLACVGATCDPTWAICVPPDNMERVSAIRAILASPTRKIFQNAMFDIIYLERAGYKVKCEDDRKSLIEDIMVMHGVTWPNLYDTPYQPLDLISSIYTREPYYKDERKIAEASDYADLDRYYIYNCKDVRVTHECYLALTKELEQQRTKTAYELNMKPFLMLREGTHCGIRCDTDRLHHLIEQHRTKAAELQTKLRYLLGEEFNARGRIDTATLIYDIFKVPKRAKRSVKQDVLMDIAAQTDDPIIRETLKLIIQTRVEENIQSKYLNERLIDIDERIRSDWNLIGTENGRLSATKAKYRNRGASLQTFPYEARKVCIADDGYMFIKPDQSQAEARLVAHLAQDYKTLSWLRDGLDIHSKMASAIFGIPYDEVRRMHKEKKGGDQLPIRYLSKKGKHASNYGIGPRTLKLSINREFHETGVGVSEAETRQILDTIHAEHPALKTWWREVENELKHKKSLTTPLGRKRIFTDRWGPGLLRDAVAFIPQSMAADVNKIGLARVRTWLRQMWPNNPYVCVLLEAHDGSLIQIPDDGHTLEHCRKIADLLTVPLHIKGDDVVIPVEVSTGYCWAEMEEVKL